MKWLKTPNLEYIIFKRRKSKLGVNEKCTLLYNQEDTVSLLNLPFTSGVSDDVRTGLLRHVQCTYVYADVSSKNFQTAAKTKI